MEFTIDCETCTRRATDQCDDCVVTFLVAREPDDAVVVEVAEYAAVRRLQQAGLVPALQYEKDFGQTG